MLACAGLCWLVLVAAAVIAVTPVTAAAATAPAPACAATAASSSIFVVLRVTELILAHPGCCHLLEKMIARSRKYICEGLVETLVKRKSLFVTKEE